uniref:NR LBD domain-containing protein n=1 Tax=Caenorhabditis tropicalis TaxID=1561998 RepID=A0A1I7T4Z5_9PELO
MQNLFFDQAAETKENGKQTNFRKEMLLLLEILENFHLVDLPVLEDNAFEVLHFLLYHPMDLVIKMEDLEGLEIFEYVIIVLIVFLNEVIFEVIMMFDKYMKRLVAY